MCSNFKMMEKIEFPPMTKWTVAYNYWSIYLHHSQEGPNKAFFHQQRQHLQYAYSLKQKKAFG